MDLTSNSSSSFISQAVISYTRNAEEDGPLVMEDSCTNFDVRNNTCIVSILGDQKAELSGVEGGKSLALLAADTQEEKEATTGGMVSIDRTRNEIDMNCIFSPGAYYSNALVKYHILLEEAVHLKLTVIDFSSSYDLHQNQTSTVGNNGGTTAAAFTANGTWNNGFRVTSAEAI